MCVRECVGLCVPHVCGRKTYDYFTFLYGVVHVCVCVHTCKLRLCCQTGKPYDNLLIIPPVEDANDIVADDGVNMAWSEY